MGQTNLAWDPIRSNYQFHFPVFSDKKGKIMNIDLKNALLRIEHTHSLEAPQIFDSEQILHRPKTSAMAGPARFFILYLKTESQVLTTRVHSLVR